MHYIYLLEDASSAEDCWHAPRPSADTSNDAPAGEADTTFTPHMGKNTRSRAPEATKRGLKGRAGNCSHGRTFGQKSPTRQTTNIPTLVRS